MTRRLYFGRLNPEARSDDLSKFLEGYGRVVDCRVMTGFGFVEFESSRDAEEVVQNFNGKMFMGGPIVVEFAKENRPPRREFDDRSATSMARARRPPGYRLIVSGISRDTSWQDLKDFAREGGNVTFADIDRDTPGQGIVEYSSREDADNAVKTLDGRDLRGQSVRVALGEESRGGGGYNERRDDRYRDERPPRRDRSRSPPRRDYDRDDRDRDHDRRQRSPPRRERSPPRDYDRRASEYDDRRHDDRRGGRSDYDRPRERDERRDDRGRANGADSGFGAGR